MAGINFRELTTYLNIAVGADVIAGEQGPLPVAIISGSGSTQYTEDTASVGGEQLMLAGAVRRDAAASSSTTDGDYSTINTDSVGRLWANVGLPLAAVLVDAAANPTTSVVRSNLSGYNGATWDLLRSVNTGQLVVTSKDSAGVEVFPTATTGDAKATATMGQMGARAQVYNGATWDMVRGVNTGQLVTTIKDSAGVETMLGVASGDALATATLAQIGSRNELYNATTWDRMRSVNAADNTSGIGLQGTAMMAWDGATVYRRLLTDSTTNFGLRVALYTGSSAVVTGSAMADAASNSTTRIPTASFMFLANATPTWDRVRSVAAAAASTGLGILATGAMAFDGTNYQPLQCDATNKFLKSSDGGTAWTTSYGVSNAVVSSADASGAAVSLTAAPTGGQKIVVDDIFFSCDTAMRADFKEETSGTVLFSAYFPANCGMQQATPRGRVKLPTADKKLQLQTSAAGNVRCTAIVHSEA